ncbi:DUF4352 domain-containing protein [Streptomyces sp. NPDC088400]|uniref:DUF4352 domain-containing protein n=1 Tax=Streptomyces sp. NPDC088400 TaxID=3365861 RepID=UPI0037F66DA7
MAPAIAVSALVTGCMSSGTRDKPEAAEAAVESPADPVAEESAEPSESASDGPSLTVGESGSYDVVETDEYGENPAVTTKMQVTVKSAKYVSPSEIDTTNEPTLGQYVVLTLTIKNVGPKPGEFAGYGVITWEDGDTAAQDATTLEGVGDSPELDTTYKPGQSVTGSLVLDVGAKGGTLSYEEGTFTVELPTS